MRRRIAWLVAATTSAVVLAFLIPLALLVKTVAADRAMAGGNDEARAVGILVSGLHADPGLGPLIARVDERSPAETTVLMPDGTILGTQVPGIADDPDVITALEGNAFTDFDEHGGEILIPVITEDGTSVVRTTVATELMRDGVYRAWLSIGLLGLLLLIAAVAIADRLGRRVSIPVTALAGVAERLQEGDLEARAIPQGPPETVELAGTMNRLAERISELLAAERAAVGDLSHRLRTPVTALRLDVESVGDADLAERLDGHIEQLQRTIDAIVRDARRPLHSSLASGCDATAVVEERAAFWSALAEDQGREVRVEVPGHPVHVGLDPADVTDILDVLIDNVFAHTADDVGFAVSLIETDSSVVIEVADTGHGVREPRPVAEARPGTTGLGLQIVRRSAARVGGHLSLTDSNPGLVARVTFPRTSAHPPGA